MNFFYFVLAAFVMAIVFMYVKERLSWHLAGKAIEEAAKAARKARGLDG